MKNAKKKLAWQVVVSEFMCPIEFSKHQGLVSVDKQEYGRRLAALGVTAADIPAYISLWQCVAPQDRQEVVRF